VSHPVWMWSKTECGSAEDGKTAPRQGVGRRTMQVQQRIKIEPGQQHHRGHREQAQSTDLQDTSFDTTYFSDHYLPAVLQHEHDYQQSTSEDTTAPSQRQFLDPTQQEPPALALASGYENNTLSQGLSRSNQLPDDYPSSQSFHRALGCGSTPGTPWEDNAIAGIPLLTSLVSKPIGAGRAGIPPSPPLTANSSMSTSAFPPNPRVFDVFTQDPLIPRTFYVACQSRCAVEYYITVRVKSSWSDSKADERPMEVC